MDWEKRQILCLFSPKKKFLFEAYLQVKTINEIENLTDKDQEEESFILITEIKGELEGVCYLIFSQEEVKYLLEASLPESIRNEEAKLKVMGNAILLEMDNIIAASVITQFSNFFNYKMYGDVPKLEKFPLKELRSYIDSNTAAGDNQYCLYFKSDFHTNNLQVRPEFIWLLNEKYISGVKSIASNDDILAKIRNTEI